jgi:hypothetical protein
MPEADDWLDHELRNVPVPSGLRSALLRIAAQSDDAHFDAVLCDVTVPAGLLDRLQAVAAAPADHSRWSSSFRASGFRLAVAASLLVAVGLSYFGAMVASIGATYQLRVVKPSALASESLLQWGVPEFPVPVTEFRSDFDHDPGWLASAGRGESDPGVGGDFLRSIDVPALADAVVRSFPKAEQDHAIASKDTQPGSRDGQAYLGQNDLGQNLVAQDMLLSDTLLAGLSSAWGKQFFSASALGGEVFAGRRVAAPETLRSGIDLPADRLFDRMFLLEYGIFPPWPAKGMPAMRIPLDIGTASYQSARMAIEAGHLPAAAEIRTEEFLAALDYGFPKPASQAVGLTVAAGPSPLGLGGLGLMQVGVQARELRAVRHAAVDLTIAVDLSSAPGAADRLTRARSALAAVAGQLGPDDRVTLISLGAAAYPLIEEAGPQDRAAWLAAVAALEPDPGLHARTGLLTALASASSTGASGAAAKNRGRKIVLLTDAAGGLDSQAIARVQQVLALPAAAGLRLDVVQFDSGSQDDPLLVKLARVGHGKLRRVDKTHQLRAALVEIFSGQSQAVATEVRLTVNFNVSVVDSYRLLGHEPPSGYVAPAPLSVSLLNGQSATALFEVQLLPTMGGDDEEIAVAQLEWRDPRDGQPRKTTQKLWRSQVSGSFPAASPTLQLAMLGVVTAEVLRNSPFASGLTLGDVVRWSREVNGAMAARDSFRDFVALVQKADRIKPQRGAPRTNRVR